MAISAINYLLEQKRQKATQDDKFFLKMLMFFELKVPESVGLYGTSYIFPLVVPPQSYSISEPFTVEATPTQGGGLYVEENGIVQRTISISGTTGFKPRGLPSSGSLSLTTVSPEKKSYGRKLTPFLTDAISGQRHIQYLQDAVFRTYADLKRDPNTSEKTQLIFHNPKDGESWLVVPQNFSIERSAGRGTLYNYTIQLLVVEQAESVDENFSEDAGLLGAIANTVANVKKGIELAQGAIKDLTAIAAEIKGYIKDIAVIIDNVNGVINAATDFVNGVSDLIQSPLAIVNSLAETIDAVAATEEALEQAKEDIQQLPITIKKKFSDMGDALDALALNPAAFAAAMNTVVQKFASLVHPLDSLSTATKTKAANTAAPTTLMGVNKLGTQMTAGDLQIASGRAIIGQRVTPVYKSGKQVTLNEGDTLTSLAAKYLGDARRWQDIAIVNGLKPPFINRQASIDLTKADEAALPGVLGIGDKIIVPSTSKGPKDLPVPVVLGVKSWEPLETHLLGRDIEINLISETRPDKPMYDIPIDVEGGSTDIKAVAGIPNLTQGLTIRMTTEKGTDALYRELGLDRVIGLNIASLQLETLRFRIGQALKQDARLSSIRSIVFEGLDNNTELDPSISLDTVIADIVAEVRGFTDNANVRLMV
jgi:nucleoid-associated protein YgaU